MKYKVLITVLCLLTLNSCKEGVDDRTGPFIEQFKILELSTDFGEMYIHLYDETPLHKANFDSLTREAYYDGTEFHRCVDDFVIQGGSPTSKDDNRNNDGSGGPGYTIPAEIDSSMFKHNYGSLAAARLGDVSNPQRRSSGSQFYIVTDEAGEPFLDGKYTVFGEVLAGMDVAKTIERQPKNSNGLPDKRIKMTVQYVQLTQTELDEKGIVLP